MTHLGVPPAEHAGATAAISPTRVWARMLRNLQATHELLTAANCIRMPHTWPTGMRVRFVSNQVREPRGSAEARFWEDAGVGLDGPVDSKHAQ